MIHDRNSALLLQQEQINELRGMLEVTRKELARRDEVGKTGTLWTVLWFGLVMAVLTASSIVLFK